MLSCRGLTGCATLRLFGVAHPQHASNYTRDYPGIERWLLSEYRLSLDESRPVWCLRDKEIDLAGWVARSVAVGGLLVAIAITGGVGHVISWERFKLAQP